MCFTRGWVRLAIPALIIGLCTMGASPCTAQTRVTSLEELRRALSAGDLITIVPTDGEPVAGRLMRLGDADLDIRVVNRRTREVGGPRDVTLRLDAIQSLERPRDSARSGTVVGAGIGAGFGGAMFVHAFVVDRNEMDEWAPLYLGVGAVCTGIGALIGWAIDTTRSKPHITFEPSLRRATKVSVQPVYRRARGISLAVSF